MRSRTWLGMMLLAACTVNPPPPQYGYAPQPYPAPAPQPDQAPPPQPDQAPPPPDQAPPPPEQAYTPPAVGPSYDVPLGPVYDDVNVSLEGQAVLSVDAFYTKLSPYGSWYDDPTYGWVFAPTAPDYQLYTNGHWQDADIGFTWVSSDPFGPGDLLLRPLGVGQSLGLGPRHHVGTGAGPVADWRWLGGLGADGLRRG